MVKKALLWKKCPLKFFSVLKEHVVVFSGSVSRDYKMKYLFTFNSQKPHTLRILDKYFLPIHCRPNRKAYMTKTIFEDSF